MVDADEVTLQIDTLLRRAVTAGVCPGAACAVALDGRPVLELYAGDQAALDADGRPLAREQRVPVTALTRFDLASVTKLFTAHTALALVNAGTVALDAPIGEVLASYRTGDRARVTLRHLLSHTSGLPATWSGWRAPLAAVLAGLPEARRLTVTPLGNRADLVADLLATPLEAPPANRFLYSCAGYLTAMAYLERLTGRAWADLVRLHTLEPLGLGEVTGLPDPARAAATEYQPALHRGVVCGVVHDEAAWSLGGNAGNAGLFATARELLMFGEALRHGQGLVTQRWMWDDALTPVLGRATSGVGGGFGAALGPRIDDRDFMGARARGVRGHAGFTGASLQVDRGRGTTLALLTNRVHPSRDGQGVQDLRRAVADVVADAVGGDA